MKKIISLVLALVMILMVGAAFADTYTVASQSSYDAITGHTYKAYQVLTGSYTGNKYVDMAWATGVSDTAKEALIALTTDQDDDSDVDFDDLIAALGDAENDDTLSMNIVDYVKDNLSQFPTGVPVTSGSTVLDTGLWVLIDESGASNVAAVNRALLYPSNGTAACTIISKVDAPSSDKATDDINDSNTSDAATNATDVKYADYDIGDHVPYVIKATLPGDYADYNTYYLKFVDKISTGLTYDGNAKIYFGSSDTEGTSITLTAGTAETINSVSYTPYTFEITDTKTSTYDELGALGAGAEIRIEYTCTLNSSAVKTVAGNPNIFYIEYSNNPDSTGDGEHGTTPPTIVIILTYNLTVNKVDENRDDLNGADFRLEKWNGTDWDEDYATTGEGDHPKKTGDSTGHTFTFAGLDDGKYRLVETATPAGYNSIDPIVFWVKATHGASGVDVKIYDEAGTTELTGDFTVTLTGDITASTEIKNMSGVTLPSTGGIGTTIFYILGGLLVVGAAVILVARRKAQD